MPSLAVQVASNVDSANTSTLAATFSGAVTSGNCVVGVFSGDASGSFTTATIADDKGNNYPLVDNIVDAGNGQRALTFLLGNITNGPVTVTVTANSNTIFKGMCIAEYAASAVSNPSDGHTGQLISSSTPTSGNITTTVDGDTIVGLINCTGSLGIVSLSAGTGESIAVSSNLASEIPTGIEDKSQTTHGIVAADWSATNTAWIAFIIALKPGGGGGDTFANNGQILFI